MVLALVPGDAEGDGIVQPRRRIRDSLVEHAQPFDRACYGTQDTLSGFLTYICNFLCVEALAERYGKHTFHRVGGALVGHAVVRRSQAIKRLESSRLTAKASEVRSDPKPATLHCDQGALATGRAPASERPL